MCCLSHTHTHNTHTTHTHTHARTHARTHAHTHTHTQAYIHTSSGAIHWANAALSLFSRTAWKVNKNLGWWQILGTLTDPGAGGQTGEWEAGRTGAVTMNRAYGRPGLNQSPCALPPHLSSFFHVHIAPKLQALVYDILPSTTAVFS